LDFYSVVSPPGRRQTGDGSSELLVSNWPYTLIIIMPVNKALEATEPKDAGARTRALIEQWGSLHAIRSALGAAATLAFLWSLTAG
jgi:uncharacterized membrane protein